MKMLPVLLAALGSLVPAQAAAPGPAVAPVGPQAVQATELESRLKGLEGRLAELDSGLDTNALVSALISLEQWAPGSKEAVELARKVAPIIEEHRKATAPMILEMTLLARRLEEYKRTGTLPADVPDHDRLARFLADPWPTDIDQETPKVRSVRPLELDVRALEKQLDRRAEPIALASKPKAPAGSALAAPAAVPAREVAASDGPKLERDAGAGLPVTDPMPGLLELLSSTAPYQRALAADELGRHGKEAARIVPSLRKALQDKDPRVRGSAALSLGGMGGLPPDAIEEVRSLLRDTNPDVRFSAKTALQRLEQSGP